MLLRSVNHRRIDHPPHHTGVGRFGVADLAGLVDGLAGQAEVGGCWSDVPVQNVTCVVPVLLHLSTLLRRVVLVGQPPLRLRLDVECIGLRAVDRGPVG